MMHMLNTVPKSEFNETNTFMACMLEEQTPLFNKKAWFDLSGCAYSQGKRD